MQASVMNEVELGLIRRIDIDREGWGFVTAAVKRDAIV